MATPEQLTRELSEVLAIPSGSDDLRAALPRLGRFLDKYRGQELAHLDYAPSLYLFLNGEYDAAVRGLESYFERYERLPVSGHDRLVGQVYVNAILEQATQPQLDPVRVQGMAMRALDLRQAPTRVGSAVHMVLQQSVATADVARVRLTLVRRVLADQQLTEADRDRALRSLYGTEQRDEVPGATEPMAARATAMSGASIDLSELRGRVVLVHFWASWCPITTAEAPALVKAYELFHTQGLEIVGVAIDASSADDVRAAARALGYEWEQVHVKDFDDALVQRFGIESVPGAVLLDRRGVACARGHDARDAALDRRLATLFAR